MSRLTFFKLTRLIFSVKVNQYILEEIIQKHFGQEIETSALNYLNTTIIYKPKYRTLFRIQDKDLNYKEKYLRKLLEDKVGDKYFFEKP